MSSCNRATNPHFKNRDSVPYHSLSKEETLQHLNSSASGGLTSAEAQKRLKTYGPNQLECAQKKSLLLRFFSQFTDFMIIILIAAAVISFVVSLLEGHADYVDPSIIFAIILLNAILGVLQEAKAEKSLEALKKMSAPNAFVLREGRQFSIPSKDLVPGDIIFLETGYFVPADARLLDSANLKIDESSLTGESHPVEKNCDCILAADTMLGDRNNLVPATGIVTYGRGKAVVTATGMNTEVGNIAKMILEDVTPDTPLQKRLAQTGKILGIAALFICIIIFILGTTQGRPVFDMFMTSVSLAVAAIPEGLPAIVTIMLSLGVQRMVKKNAVIRKLPAVETLGSATVICSDKTGTLTQNRMTVTALSSSTQFETPNSDFATFLLSLATLCNDSVVQIKDKKLSVMGEPTETALAMAAYDLGINKTKLDLTSKRIFEIPFDSTRKRMTTVHKNPYLTSYLSLEETMDCISITKGAPDILINKCSYYCENGTIKKLTSTIIHTITQLNLTMTQDALRVIAIAFKPLKVSAGTPKNWGNDLESSLVFVGLVGMIDPPRPEVKDAVFTCKRAGIKPVMITGDHISTACAIGKELHIISNNSQAISGQELNSMSDEELKNTIHKFGVFARVSPEHKVRIVKAFQNNGEIVAMTGDGVNDAPALKCADIGCAMGITGTDVAKNAADMILTDDNFATIVSAVSEGRGIYDNIRKSIHFLLSSNIGEIITIFIAILFGLQAPLVAVQLLWVNLVTDSLPAISLGMEPVEKDIMKRKPISPSKGIFSDGLFLKIIIEGMLIGSLSLLAYVTGIAVLSERSLSLGRTMCFSVLSLSQLFHSFNMRSEHSLFTIGLFSNKQLLFSFLLGTALQISVVTCLPLAAIFKVIPLTIQQWFIVFALSSLPVLLVEFQKKVIK
ncbi:calcium-translocating P-type ATPase, PMCA-type [Anaeromicropila populeti]|uniref:P-type Ca(2+) transporter n=1 Tax=Anaeromicropila populeti TaxID=37658 RepID=A0A1I6IRV2_9FIRM|nr:calcium-translocating P-type ATPase, PMCA-type [Anaeromicropila populeti]SFR68970.1 Ca2+-transporting ATPase [Anaeromicropila populeti]